jgi:hypothetical protein
LSTPLVTVRYAKVFDNYERELRKAQAEATKDSGAILRRHVEQSMRLRWYRTGASVEALSKGEVIEEGNRVTFRLVGGKFYDIFGEYGTGVRGAATGQPAPKGYTYGGHEKGSMTARRFSRLAIDAARSEIQDLHLLKMREFARGMVR